jgi:prepilin-type N-terminal cleavage/methylation domain-containing protein
MTARRNGGFTLAEVLAATAILAVVALTLTVAFGAAQSVARRGDDRAAALDAVSAVLETGGGEAAPGAVTFRVGETAHTVDGVFRRSTDAATGVGLTAFVPGAAP